MQGSYSPALVVLSVLVAILASYAALDLAGRVGHRRWRIEWIVGGSVAMGAGIWSMHYVAMLALRMPVPMVYDLGLLILSLVVAIAAASVAFSIVALRKVSHSLLFAAAALMGAAIAGMHYIGMWALAVHTPARLAYDPLLVAASLLVAYVASLGALWLAFRFRTGEAESVRKLGAAVLMGFAISGMHYTAMAAARFAPLEHPAIGVPQVGVLGTPTLGWMVAGGAVLVLCLGIAGAAVDRGAQAVLRSEARFRSVVENISDVVTLMDAQGITRYVSPALERMLGYAPAERIGRTPLELVHPDDLPEVQRVLEEVLRQPGSIVALETRVRHRDGSWRRVEVLGRNLLHEPGVEAVLFTSRDLSQRDELEEQLRHAQKMDAIGRLAGGVAHDFNNLLTVVKGHAQFALESMEKEDPRRAELKEVLGAAERAAALTAQLLAFSRRQVLKPKLLNLNEIVAKAERMLSRVIGEDIELSAILAEDVGRVQADPGQMEQVLVNLIVNARDAIQGGGRITIHTRDVHVHDPAAEGVRDLAPGAYVVLSVRDTGVGMKPGELAHVFEPFFTTKPAGQGTGLGLSTVYGIVKQSGGAIRVTSTPGRGATFEIFLPRVAGGATQREREATASAPRLATRQGTILVVEDEDALRSLIVRTLRREGYEVLDAETPEAALRLAHGFEGRIDLLVSDVVMPGMSGVEFAEQLRLSRPDTLVIFISGYASEEVIRRGVIESAAPFLAKPFMPNDLVALVNEVMERGGAQSNGDDAAGVA